MRKLILTLLIVSSFPSSLLHAEDKSNISGIKVDQNKIDKNNSNKVIWTHVKGDNKNAGEQLIWKDVDERDLLDIRKAKDNNLIIKTYIKTIRI